MEKLFTVAGTSRRNGTVKFRFTNDRTARIPMLVRTGHTEIRLVDLPEPMTRSAAAAYLISQGIEPNTELTADTLRAELEADGIDTSTMSTEFLREAAGRENQ